MTLFFYIIIGVITFGAFLHAWSKKDFNVSRTIVINRPKAEGYAFVRQLKKQPQWMPWFNLDSQMQLKFKGEDGKLDAAIYWKGNNRVGEGMQRITKVREGKVLESQLLFLKPYKAVALLYLGVKEVEPGRTKMVLGISGVHKFPASVLSIFYGLEKVIGEDLEKGLRELKNLLE